MTTIRSPVPARRDSSLLRSRLSFAVMFSLGVVAAANVPIASTAALFLFAARAVLTILRRPPPRRAIGMITVLLAFAFSYFAFLAAYEFSDPLQGAKHVAMIVGAYVAGVAIGGSTTRTTEARATWLLLAFPVGLTAYAFLSAYLAFTTGSGIDEANRIITSFWDITEPLNATVAGAMAALGAAALQIPLFGNSDPDRTGHRMLAVAAILLATGGIFVNLVLQNRGPFLGLAGSTAVSVAIFVRDSKVARASRWRRASLLAIVVLCAFAWATADDTIWSHFVFRRFQSEGLESLRYEAWGRMLTHLFSAPFGGRTVDLGEVRYVHNIWLDVAWDAGLIPFTLLVVFHLWHIAPYSKALASKLSLDTRLLLSAGAIAFFVAFVAEPVLSFSPLYFASSCLFLGFVTGLRTSEFAPENPNVLTNVP